MAIKGKRKPKARSPRVVTAGPRPAYVPPKVPPFQRTGTKFLVALLFEAVIFSLLVGFGEQSADDKRRLMVTEFSSLVDASLSRAGTAIQPLQTSALVLPELGPRIAELQGEDPPAAEDVITEADTWASSLARAADGLVAVQVPDGNWEVGQRNLLFDARNLMDRGLRIFITLTEELKAVVQIEGEPQAQLITTIQNQIPIATGIFDSGYSRLQEMRRRVGLPTTSTSISSGGIPGIAPEPAFPPGEAPPLEVPVEAPVEAPADEGGGNGGGNGGGGGDGGGGGGNG